MAWARGFFRAWIVLTIVWTIGAGLWSANVVLGSNSNPYSQDWLAYPGAPYFAPLRIDKDGLLIVEIALRDVRGSLYYDDGMHANDLQLSLTAVRAELDELQASYDRIRTDFIPWGIAMVVLPPLLVLALGAVVGWVARGFRREQPGL